MEQDDIEATVRFTGSKVIAHLSIQHLPDITEAAESGDPVQLEEAIASTITCLDAVLSSPLPPRHPRRCWSLN